MKISNLLWGIVFIVVGLILGLNALEITNINLFFDGWWTFFIIVPCFIDLFKDEDITGNVVGLVIGLCLLLACNDLIDFVLIWKLMIPVILVLIGLSFIFKDTINSKVKKEIKRLNKVNDNEYCATFGSQNVGFNDEEFNGCNLTAVFGEIKCDLRDAVIKEDCVINVSAIFGSVTVLVPENIKIKVTSTPIFGGISNKVQNKKEGKVTLYLNGTCLFGGVDLK